MGDSISFEVKENTSCLRFFIRKEACFLEKRFVANGKKRTGKLKINLPEVITIQGIFYLSDARTFKDYTDKLFTK